MAEVFEIKKCRIQTKDKNVEVAYFDTDVENKVNCYLYLFPGQGSNEEWDIRGGIVDLMKIILQNKRHPSMRIIMPYIYANNGEECKSKIEDAQKVTSYIEDIANCLEGENSWQSIDGYKRRAVAGVCLGALSALKLGLYWEQPCKGMKEKFHSVAMLSPANDAGAANWICGPDAFKFANNQHHRVYISCGSKDNKYVHANRYAYNFIKNDLTLTITLKSFIGGGHDWTCFKKGFEDFMSENIYSDEYYKNI